MSMWIRSSHYAPIRSNAASSVILLCNRHQLKNPSKKIKSKRSPSPSIPGIDSTYSQIKTQVPQYAPPVQPVQDSPSQERLERLGKNANGGDVPSSRLNEFQHQPSYPSTNDRDKDNRSHDSQRRPEERRQRDVDNRSLDVSKVGCVFRMGQYRDLFTSYILRPFTMHPNHL